MKSSRSTGERMLNDLVGQKNKVSQIRRSLFNLVQAEVKPTSVIKANNMVTTNITIRMPVLRVNAHRNIVRVVPKASTMKLYKLFPLRNSVQATTQKLNTQSVKQSITSLNAVDVILK